MDPGPGYYRPITPKRKTALTGFYEQTALGKYDGFTKRMAVYAEKGDLRQKRVAALFSGAQMQEEKRNREHMAYLPKETL
jgi:hypothetical protein